MIYLHEPFTDFKEKNNIETRPIFKPCHLQKEFKKYQRYKISNAEKLYKSSFCLPSEYGLKKKVVKKIVIILNNYYK